MGEWSEAARYWREAVARPPGDEDMWVRWYNLGDALLQAGHCREAIEALRKSLRLGNKQAAWAYYDLASCYHKLGDIVRARASCDQALRLAPDDADARELNKELGESQLQ